MMHRYLTGYDTSKVPRSCGAKARPPRGAKGRVGKFDRKATRAQLAYGAVPSTCTALIYIFTYISSDCLQEGMQRE